MNSLSAKWEQQRIKGKTFAEEKLITPLENVTDIIQACLRGDQTAQRALYEMHRVRWYMTSLRYGKNKMEAEDILQEGLIRIYTNLKQFDHRRGAFTTWSNRVIVNAALRYLKRFNWMDTLDPSETATELKVEGEDVFGQMRTKELTKMIQQLPIGYRVVFNMYAIEGYKHEEIAKELGIKVGTSKSQLYKARKTLRTQLEEQILDNRDA